MSFTSKWESDHIWFLCKPGTPSTKICGKHMETSFLPSWKHLSASFLGAGIFYPYLEFQGVPKDFCWGPSMTRWTSQHPTHKWPVAASPIYHQEITELGHLSPVISGHVKNHGPFSSFRIRFFFSGGHLPANSWVKNEGKGGKSWNMIHEFGFFHGHVCHFGYQVSICFNMGFDTWQRQHTWNEVGGFELFWSFLS